MHILALILAFLSVQIAGESSCTWGPAIQIGSLPPSIDEASGLAVSRRFRDRMYHINDSGDDGRFFITDMAGRNTGRITLAGRDLDDTEDLALAPCGAAVDCLFIGDIGDNDRNRKEIEIVVVEELANFPERVRPRSRVRAVYPDGPHDAESLAVHPDGTIYILTKSLEVRGVRASVGPASIYRLERDAWQRPGNSPAVLKLVTTLELGKLLPTSLLGGRIPTGMNISADGNRVLILTYQNAIELFINLSSPIPPVDRWKMGQYFRSIPLVNLEQQEAISWAPDGKAFIYTTERRNARIMMVRCN